MKKSKSQTGGGSEISEKEAIQLRKFLEDGCEFQGLAETAIAVLKREDSR